jgi:O-antigen ligase/tetratricopeptide (TPR) repeat protein
MPEKYRKASKSHAIESSSSFDYSLIIPFLLTACFLFVDFVPQFRSVDIMGPHWLYLSIINGVTLLYLFTIGRKRLLEQLGAWSQSLLTILVLAFFIIAGFSIFGAINKGESIVVYARFSTTVLMYFNISLLMLGRLPLMSGLAVVVSLILLIQSIQILGQFNQGITEDQPVDQIISNLRGNSGNKNILAASLAFELSMVIYLLLSIKNWFRIIPALIIIMGLAALVLVNARASFVSVAVQLVIFLTFGILWTIREKRGREGLIIICWVVVPFLFGVFSGNTILDQAIESQGKATGYNTIAERAKTITFSSSGRTNLWISAIDYIKKHPLMGAGFGNWKIASIPYEKDSIDEFYVAYHAHNDFLEMAAETGWIGGLIFLSIFFIATFYLLTILLRRNSTKIYWLATCISMSLASYFIDATFNFPCERPIMQMYLALTLAAILSVWVAHKATIKNPAQKNRLSFAIWAVGLIGLCILGFAINVNHKVFISMKAQAYINADALKLEPELSYEKVSNDLPSFPNLNAFCFSPDVIKSRYLIKEKRFDEALVLLEKSRKVSAQISINEQFTAMAFLGLNKKDSAFYWIEKAFYYRPRVRNNYILLNQLLVERRDSAGIEKAFKRLQPIRDEAYVWGVYLNSLAQVGASPLKIKALTDSAIRKFPTDPDMQNRKTMIAAAAAQPYASEGLRYFANKDYARAVTFYKKAAELNPNDYAYFENVGLCYLGQSKYVDAIQWFDKVIALGTARDVKSIFYKGFILVRIGKKAEGCEWLGRAAGQNYPGAVEEMRANNCK